MTFDTLYNMVVYYNTNMAENTKISVSNVIKSETMYFHIYKLPKEFVFKTNSDVSNLMSLCTSTDTYTQVIIGHDVAINKNVTFTPPYRCRGMVLYIDGLLVNNGTITMTARGSTNTGQNIYLYKLNNTYQIVPKNGALGADRVDISAQWDGPWAANRGYNGTGRQTGGGANGAQGHGDGDHWSRICSMGGGDATSYSGGSGGGGCDVNHPGTFTMPKPVPGTGPGGDGYGVRWSSRWYNRNGGGGAGNPGGRGRYASGWSNALNGESGTGGLLVIYSARMIGVGTYTATGSKGGGGNKGGGGSGGGSINIFTGTDSVIESTKCSAAGGGSMSNGGTGGNGTVTINYISFPKILINVYHCTQNIDLEHYTFKDHDIVENISDVIIKDFTGFTYKETEPGGLNNKVGIHVYYKRNSYNLTVNNGFSEKYTYLYEEKVYAHYDRHPENYLRKFGAWISNTQIDIVSYLRDAVFYMPASDVTISAEFTDQDRVNTNIYKNIFDSFLFDLYNFQSVLNGIYKKETSIFQYNHGFSKYDLVRINQIGLYEKGLATEEQYDVIGMVSEIISENEFILTTYGPIETDINFTSESGVLYLSDTQQGKFCTFEELSTDFYTPVGFYTGNTITVNILDSSVGDVLKKYNATVYEHEQDLPHITVSDKQNIIQEVLNNA